MKNYIKLLILLAILIPNVSLASFDKNLKYGAKGEEVVELQEFLIEQGLMTGQATGNFYAVTLKAVKAFQTLHNIKPISGYFGAITRAKATSLLELDESNIEAVKEEVPTPLPTYQPVMIPSYQAPAPITTQVVDTPIIQLPKPQVSLHLANIGENYVQIVVFGAKNGDNLKLNLADKEHEIKVTDDRGSNMFEINGLTPLKSYNFSVQVRRDTASNTITGSFITPGLTN